jgi:hypothetical protein
MNIIIRYLLPSLHPEVLKTQFIFPLGLVTSPEVGMLPGEPAKPVRISAQFRCHAQDHGQTRQARDPRLDRPYLDLLPGLVLVA